MNQHEPGLLEMMDAAEAAPEDLKEQINAFLWTPLGPKTTLAEAEAIAAELHDRVLRTWAP